MRRSRNFQNRKEMQNPRFEKKVHEFVEPYGIKNEKQRTNWQKRASTRGQGQEAERRAAEVAAQWDVHCFFGVQDAFSLHCHLHSRTSWCLLPLPQLQDIWRGWLLCSLILLYAFVHSVVYSFDLHFLAQTAQKKLKDRIQELLDRQSGLPQPTFAQRVALTWKARGKAVRYFRWAAASFDTHKSPRLRCECVCVCVCQRRGF